MDALEYIKSLSKDEADAFFEEMLESSCYKSMFKGFITEHKFKKNVVKRGWLCEKIKDNDQRYRYDFDVLNNKDIFRIEVKLMNHKGKANADFRDSRDIELPTGKRWRTRARHFSEDFDYLALHDGVEFYLAPFTILQPLEARDLKETKKHAAVFLTEEERDWIRENYVDGRVTITDTSKCLKISDIE